MYRAAREHDDDDDDGDHDLAIDSYRYTDRQMNHLVEVELVAGSSAEDTFLHCGFTWRDFYSWARGKIVLVWITPDVCFDMTSIDIDFHSDVRSFLSVCIEVNEGNTSKKPNYLGVCARSEAHVSRYYPARPGIDSATMVRMTQCIAHAAACSGQQYFEHKQTTYPDLRCDS
jgi:hypothetical protein